MVYDKNSKINIFAYFSRFTPYSESSHNGIAAVLKTAARKGVGVRVPRSPQNPL